VKAIVRELEGCECREQAAKGASVRTFAMATNGYDSYIADGSRPSPVPLDIPMNVTLKPFDFAQAVARAGLNTNGQPLSSSNAVQGPGFQQALSQALDAVNKSQNDATEMQQQVQLDNPTVSLEQTMVAMQKAQIGFAATLQVRNKLVQAYSDIMQMQV
jgi:flagellar hook-basal body complex protein FliE